MEGEEKPSPWTLSQCVKWALSHHPSITNVKAQIEEAEAGTKGALSVLYPKVAWTNTLTGQQSSFGSASALFSAAPRGSVNPAFFSEWVFGTSLGIQQAVFPWDRALDGARAMAWTTEALRAQHRQTESDLRFQIIRAFTGVLLTEHFVHIAREARAVADESERTTQGLFKEGRSSGLEVEKAKVQRLNAAASALEAESQGRIARESLQWLVAAPGAFEVAGTLTVEPVEGDLSVWEARALAERPDIKQFKAREMAAQAGVALMEKSGWPAVGVAAGYSWLNDRPGFNAAEWYKSWNVGVSVTVPVFDGWAATHQEKAARSKLDQVKAASALVETQAKLEVRQAWIQLASTLDRLSVREEQVNVAEENWRTTRDRYRLGLVSWLEVKDVELALTGARTQWAQTKHDYIVGKAALERATGFKGGNSTP